LPWTLTGRSKQSIGGSLPNRPGMRAAPLLLLFLLVAGLFPFRAGGEQVDVDTSSRYQTILGWGATAPGIYAHPLLRDQVVEVAVNLLGLTRLRLEAPSGNRSNLRRWEWLNDDGDPFHFNWPAFETKGLDERVEFWVLPFKRAVEGRGEPFSIYVSPSFFDHGSSGEVPSWLLHSPGEYAEYAASILVHLKRRFGLDVDFYCICNEAGNDNKFSPEVLRRTIPVVGMFLERLGLRTKIQFPECVSANESWRYIEALRGDPQMWRYVGLISYHLYGGNEARPKIRDFARGIGLPTAQTEFMGLTVDHLYEDLTLGGVSYWEIYGMAGPWSENIRTYPDGSSCEVMGRLWPIAQVMRYVRPGAVRVEARSTSSEVRALAFVKGGRVTVILINTSKPPAERAVEVKGLPPGTYCLSQVVGQRPFLELGPHRVGEEGRLQVRLPPNSVTAIYPHPGGNLPPTITNWGARPRHLTFPAGEAELYAEATDPELERVSYNWELESGPRGARVFLPSPNSQRTKALGLTLPGLYVFKVTASDERGGRDSRRIFLNVYEGNQPPIPVDVHNRIPVMVVLPQDSTELRGGALDIEGDELTFRWSVVEAPSGARVLLDSPTKPRCKVKGLSVPGKYVFKFEVSDGHSTACQLLTIPVYPPNRPPVIAEIRAEPRAVPAGVGSVLLSARAFDPDGEVTSLWWAVEEAPEGAEVLIESPASPATRVRGLNLPGKYVFSLVVVDRGGFARERTQVFVMGKENLGPSP